MHMPLGFVVFYLTQNVGLTRSFQDYSATVTAARNQVGKFTKDFRFMVDIFHNYMFHYHKFGPKRLPLKHTDLFLHLHQNLTYDIISRHSACVISMPYLIQSYKNLATIHSFVSQCLATNHIMTRRYPAYWNSYYILVNLFKYN